MWLTERYTFSRGRSAVPTIFLRMREWILPRVSFFDVFPIISAFPSSRGPEPGNGASLPSRQNSLVLLSGGALLLRAGVEVPPPRLSRGPLYRSALSIGTEVPQGLKRD